MWIPSLTSPLSIFNPLKNMDDVTQCFKSVFNLEKTTDMFRRVSYQSTLGITSKLFGTTRSSITKSRCGFDAISDLLPVADQLQGIGHYFNTFRVNIEKMGYVAGLTAQAIPYDFRLSYRTNDVPRVWNSILDDLYQITGKKVSIVSHSMGNMNVYHNLLNMK